MLSELVEISEKLGRFKNGNTSDPIRRGNLCIVLLNKNLQPNFKELA